MRAPRRSPVVRFTSPRGGRRLWSLGVLLVALGAARAAPGQGLRTASTVVRIVAVKPATDATTGAETLRGWDAMALVPPTVALQPHKEVRLDFDMSNGARWFLRGSDGRLVPLTAQWTAVDVGPVIRVRAVGASPSLATDRPRLLVRARTALGEWTEEVSVDWRPAR